MPKVEPGFHDRCIVVTGAASGIGLALSQRLLQSGAKLLMVDSDQQALARAIDALAPYAAQLQHVVVDVTDAVAVAHMMENAATSMGRLDYLFNNAGIAGSLSLATATLADWRRIVDINLWGVIHGVQAALPIMRRQGGGHIVNTASAFGLLPAPGRVLYATTKHAIVGLSESMRLELCDDNIFVSVACPGAVRTGIWGSKTAPPESISADAAAREILDGVANKEGIIVLPARARLGWLLYRWYPPLVERLLRAMPRAPNASAESNSTV